MVARKHWANLVTFLRLLAVPPFFVLLCLEGGERKVQSFVLFLVLALSDLLDGYLARRNGSVTNAGKFLDPVADKLLILPPFILFSVWQIVPWLMTGIIILREVGIVFFRIFADRKRVILEARFLGKMKTLSQNVAICWILVAFPKAQILIWIAFILTVLSGIDYLAKYFFFQRQNP